MENLVSLYNSFLIHEITYQVGDSKVKALCSLNYDNGAKLLTTMLISHTDLNRIIAKIAATGYEFKVDQVNNFVFDDGTTIIDYKLENVTGDPIPVEGFQFNDLVQQIRA